LNREIKSKTLGIASTFDSVVWNEDDQKQIRSFCAKIEIELDRFQKIGQMKYESTDIHDISIWQWPNEANRDWQLKLYNELSSNRTPSPLLRVTKARAFSDTGIPFDQLRFLYWRCINNLLVQAEDFELRNDDVNTTPPILIGSPGELKRALMAKAESPRPQKLHSDLRIHLAGIKDQGSRRQTYEQWRAKILNLRSIDYRPPQRKTGYRRAQREN